MKSKIQLKKTDGTIIFEYEAENNSIKKTVETYIKIEKELFKDEIYLFHSNLKEVDLHGADLQGANLSRAYLSGANLKGADLRGADLRGADLSYTDLTSADLKRTDLSCVALFHSHLKGADLRGADLSGACLNGTDLNFANLSYANLNGAILICVDLKGANLSFANLTNADLEFAKLNDAYLNNADLRWSFLAYANFKGADLSGANLSFANVKLVINMKYVPSCFIEQEKFEANRYINSDKTKNIFNRETKVITYAFNISKYNREDVENFNFEDCNKEFLIHCEDELIYNKNTGLETPIVDIIIGNELEVAINDQIIENCWVKMFMI